MNAMSALVVRVGIKEKCIDILLNYSEPFVRLVNNIPKGGEQHALKLVQALSSNKELFDLLEKSNAINISLSFLFEYPSQVLRIIQNLCPKYSLDFIETTDLLRALQQILNSVSDLSFYSDCNIVLNQLVRGPHSQQMEKLRNGESWLILKEMAETVCTQISSASIFPEFYQEPLEFLTSFYMYDQVNICPVVLTLIKYLLDEQSDVRVEELSDLTTTILTLFQLIAASQYANCLGQKVLIEWFLKILSIITIIDEEGQMHTQFASFLTRSKIANILEQLSSIENLARVISEADGYSSHLLLTNAAVNSAQQSLCFVSVVENMYDFMYLQLEPEDLENLLNLFNSTCRAALAEHKKSDNKKKLAVLCDLFLSIQKREGENVFIPQIVEIAESFREIEEVAQFLLNLGDI